jgi:maleate isomerase
MYSYVPSQERRKVGHITPSSNTVLEPLTGLMSRPFDALVSHHFTRIKVEAISLEERHTDQFGAEPMLAAAELLADAGVDAIVWNGTSGGWNGVDADRALCALISERTGIPSTTSTLAQLELLERWGLRRAGLALPYTADVSARIAGVFAAEGLEVVAFTSAGVSENRAMAHVSEERLRQLVREANVPEAECVLLYCTGIAGAQLAGELERELGKPVFDSVAVTLWKALELVGVAPRMGGWGSLFTGSPDLYAEPESVRASGKLPSTDDLVRP